MEPDEEFVHNESTSTIEMEEGGESQVGIHESNSCNTSIPVIPLGSHESKQKTLSPNNEGIETNTGKVKSNAKANAGSGNSKDIGGNTVVEFTEDGKEISKKSKQLIVARAVVGESYDDNTQEEKASHVDDRSRIESTNDEQMVFEQVEVPRQILVENGNNEFYHEEEEFSTTVHNPNQFSFQVVVKKNRTLEVDAVKQNESKEDYVSPKEAKEAIEKGQEGHQARNRKVLLPADPGLNSSVQQWNEGASILSVSSGADEIEEISKTDLPDILTGKKSADDTHAHTVTEKSKRRQRGKVLTVSPIKRKSLRSSNTKNQRYHAIQEENQNVPMQKQELLNERKMLEEIAQIRMLAKKTKQKMEMKMGGERDYNEDAEYEEFIRETKMSRATENENNNDDRAKETMDEYKIEGPEKSNTRGKILSVEVEQKSLPTKQALSRKSSLTTKSRSRMAPTTISTDHTPRKKKFPNSCTVRMTSPTSIVVLDKKTKNALNIVKTSRKLSEVMKAVTTLETTTRLSYECCEALAATDAPLILYKFMHICNRSSPRVELLQQILLTLANVSKMATLIPGIITENCVDILLDILQMFRDKEIVFSFAATLLWRIIFCSDQEAVSYFHMTCINLFKVSCIQLLTNNV